MNLLPFLKPGKSPRSSLQPSKESTDSTCTSCLGRGSITHHPTLMCMTLFENKVKYKQLYI